MNRWVLAGVLALGAHFGASYLVPLDAPSQQAFGGLLKWVWPWADGDSGPLGVTTASSGFPISGFFVAVTSAGLFILAALAIFGKWVPFPWWRPLTIIAAGLSLFVMLMFFDARKLLPIAVDVYVLWAAWTNVEIAR